MRIVFFSACIFWTLAVRAQANAYLADLAALKTGIEKTASFKAQIRGEKLSSYQDLYNRLASDTLANPNSYQYFYNLSRLLFPLRDNHLGFYQIPDYNNFKTRETIDSYVKTKEFLDYPTYNVHIDSLKEKLAAKPAESVEGIYHYDKFYTVGLFKNGENHYIGVVLNSDVSVWVKGQIAIHLYEVGPNLYKAIYGHPRYKYYILQPVEKCQNQTLANSYFYGSYSQSVYSKNISEVDHVNLPKTTSAFEFRNVNNQVQYLLVQTFQANKVTSQTSQKFYDSIKTLLNAPNLILDLRNNEGGAEKEMKKYLLLLKEYVKNGHLYILVNNGTLSQAEIFTLALKKLKNVTTIGQQTKGMLAYGSNYGRRERLPSGKFEIYLTDMNSGSELLQYEDYGIKPDITIQNDKNWIDQVVLITQNK